MTKSMTKDEAAEKVAKLMRLAKGTPESHEASSARSQARKIVREYELSAEDLSAGKKAAAFDTLVKEILHLVPPLHEPLVGAIRQKLAGLTKSHKSHHLEDASKLVEVASLVNGLLGKVGMGSSTVTKMQKILDDVLAAHGLEKIDRT